MRKPNRKMKVSYQTRDTFPAGWFHAYPESFEAWEFFDATCKDPTVVRCVMREVWQDGHVEHLASYWS